MSDAQEDPRPSGLSFARQMTAATPHARALGLEILSVERARAIGRIPFRDELAGDSGTGVIAGGVLTAMLDHVCGVAACSALEVLQVVATLDLRIDYMRPAAPGASVIADAQCYKLTRTIAFVRALAYEERADDPVAAAAATFILSGDTPRPTGANLGPPPARRRP